jgi:hypothetical protein
VDVDSEHVALLVWVELNVVIHVPLS